MLSVISFNIKDKRPEDVGSILDQKYDIMLRAGLHCAPTAHSVIGTKERGTLRIGLGYFNEKEDCMKLVFYNQAGVVCSIVNDYNRELSIKLQALLDRIDNAIDCFQGEFHRGGGSY